MRVVLDTNVLVSGLLTPGGVCRRILELMIHGVLTPCVDSRILDEYEAVIRYPRLRPLLSASEEIVSFLRIASIHAVPAPISADLPDRSDLPFLEAAKSCRAFLVIGNRRHFPRKACGNVIVLSPAELLDRLRIPPDAESSGRR